jgi:hypothetical protein
MADDATDSAFGFILFILFLALLGYAAGGVSSSPSTAGTTSGTSQSLPPLAGSAVASCPDTFTLEKDEPDVSNVVNLTVYVDPGDAGRKCATANTTSSGTLKVTLAYTADQTQMVSNMASCQSSGQPCTASVQVNGTDNYCVSAAAELGTTYKVTIPKVVEPCMMTVPDGQPASPWPLPVRSDDKVDEEGY